MKWPGKAVVAAAAVLMPLAGAGYAGSSAQDGFVGYKWDVTAITHGGKPTPIPASYAVYLAFTPNGQFVANEPVNTHSGTYRQAGGGFTTSELIVTAVGWVGVNLAKSLSISAISAFDNGAQASTAVRGNQLTVSVGGYLLDCRRDRQQANIPPAQHT